MIPKEQTSWQSELLNAKACFAIHSHIWANPSPSIMRLFRQETRNYAIGYPQERNQKSANFPTL